ncbi:unnamed protein product [Notodromas monacha]|uniref:Uncharacterized protein n=1 Tax=Notodromas monacha TaxID=399045 RepID=A0A7R9BWV2_9CRUS|nr:unnamed protein product [Notodromas monacha]CAG0921688.1 unnamed protein product [Notodromas monacha]
MKVDAVKITRVNLDDSYLILKDRLDSADFVAIQVDFSENFELPNYFHLDVDCRLKHLKPVVESTSVSRIEIGVFDEAKSLLTTFTIFPLLECYGGIDPVISWSSSKLSTDHFIEETIPCARTEDLASFLHSFKNSSDQLGNLFKYDSCIRSDFLEVCSAVNQWLLTDDIDPETPEFADFTAKNSFYFSTEVIASALQVVFREDCDVSVVREQSISFRRRDVQKWLNILKASRGQTDGLLRKPRSKSFPEFKGLCEVMESSFSGLRRIFDLISSVEKLKIFAFDAEMTLKSLHEIARPLCEHERLKGCCKGNASCGNIKNWLKNVVDLEIAQLQLYFSRGTEVSSALQRSKDCVGIAEIICGLKVECGFDWREPRSIGKAFW